MNSPSLLPTTSNQALVQPLQPELEQGEHLLWVGQEDAQRSALQSTPVFLFAIPWTAGTAHFMWSWPHHDWASLLFQGSFVLLGILMLLTPLWTYLLARRTVYGITDRRVILLTQTWTRTVQSYGEREITNLVRTERADGSGDLAFAKRETSDGDGGRKSVDVKLIGVPKVREVERLLQATFKKESDIAPR